MNRHKAKTVLTYPFSDILPLTKDDICDRVSRKYPILEGIALRRVQNATWYETEIIQNIPNAWTDDDQVESALDYMMYRYEREFTGKSW